ncbi:GAF domain-containing protein [Actinoplanes sp. NPDC026670]|uniref:GAF domain-containing protein n=1 Tax=Actinoplanes sp. NPDC026670 TaxID=3154700 RepID=UPI0033F31B03
MTAVTHDLPQHASSTGPTGSLLDAAHDLADDLRVITKVVAHHFGARTAAINLVDGDGRLVNVGAYPMPAWLGFAAGLAGRPAPCLRVIGANAAAIVQGCDGDDIYAGAPLRCGGQTVGVLCMVHEQPLQDAEILLPAMVWVGDEIVRLLLAGERPGQEFFDVMADISRAGIASWH